MIGLAALAALLTASANDAAPFLYANRLIFVEMTVNDRTGRLFLLDTGANKSAIEEALARDMGLKSEGATTVEGTAGHSEVAHLKLRKLRLASKEAKGLDVTVQGLSGIPAPEGRKVEGILGTDFIAHYAVRLDYVGKTISLGKPSSKGTFAPLEMDNAIPRVKGRIDGTTDAAFRLDTGASLFETPDVYVNIPSSLWDSLVEANPGLKPDKYFTGSGVGGDVKLAVARLSSLKLGPVEVPRPYVIVQPRAGYFARPDAVGFVSNNLLEKYGTVTIDFPGKRLYFGS